MVACDVGATNTLLQPAPALPDRATVPATQTISWKHRRGPVVQGRPGIRDSNWRRLPTQFERNGFLFP